MDVVLPAPRSDVFCRNLPSKNKMAPRDRPAAVVGCLCARAALAPTRRLSRPFFLPRISSKGLAK
eukprot:12578989-Heterocapsa_arctica.AAC.1